MTFLCPGIINTIIIDLYNKIIKVIAYTDDVVILESEIFSNALNDKCNTLNLLSYWTPNNDLVVNTRKGTALFTSKTMTTSFKLPQLLLNFSLKLC